jgi:hypothetical protein
MKILKTITFMAVLTFTSLAGAGELVRVPVEIDYENTGATGSMTSARFSANEHERIGCGVRSFKRGPVEFDWGFCFAQISEEESVICETFDEKFLKTIRALDDYSFIIFRWTEEGECYFVGNSTQSIYIPGKLK